MKRKTTAALLLQRSEWFDNTGNHEAIKELLDDGDRIIYQLNHILDIKQTWSIYSAETAEAVSVELRSLACELIILVYQTRVDQLFLDEILKGAGSRPLIAWCYLPWRRIPRPMTYEELVKGSSMYGMSVSLSQLSNSQVPYLALFGSADDPAVQLNIQAFSHAAQVSNDLTKIKLGYLALDDADGDSHQFDSLNRLGFTAQGVPLTDFTSHLHSITVDDVNAYVSTAASQSIDVMVTDDTFQKAAAAALALSNLGKGIGLDYFAVPDHHPVFRRVAGVCPGLPSWGNPEEFTKIHPVRRCWRDRIEHRIELDIRQPKFLDAIVVLGSSS